MDHGNGNGKIKESVRVWQMKNVSYDGGMWLMVYSNTDKIFRSVGIPGSIWSTRKGRIKRRGERGWAFGIGGIFFILCCFCCSSGMYVQR